MRRFLVDAQLPPALARWLAAQGHLAEHVSDCGLANAPDLAIWRTALDHGAAVITKDSDFADLRILAREGPPVVWVRLANTRRRELLVWFEAMLPDLLAALDRGERLIELA